MKHCLYKFIRRRISSSRSSLSFFFLWVSRSSSISAIALSTECGKASISPSEILSIIFKNSLSFTFTVASTNESTLLFSSFTDFSDDEPDDCDGEEACDPDSDLDLDADLDHDPDADADAQADADTDTGPDTNPPSSASIKTASPQVQVRCR